MDRAQRAQKAFVKVFRSIDPAKHPQAYRLAFSKPLKFYEDHSKTEAVKLLIAEAEQN